MAQRAQNYHYADRIISVGDVYEVKGGERMTINAIWLGSQIWRLLSHRDSRPARRIRQHPRRVLPAHHQEGFTMTDDEKNRFFDHAMQRVNEVAAKYTDSSARVLEGLETPTYRPRMAFTASDEAMPHWPDFSRQVDAEAMRLFQIEALPRDWNDRVIIGFNCLDDADVIDADRRKAAAEALAKQLGDYCQFPHNPATVIFDAENPGTVHDVLFSWATGHLTDSQVVAMLHLDDNDDLDEIARDNRVPQPKERKP